MSLLLCVLDPDSLHSHTKNNHTGCAAHLCLFLPHTRETLPTALSAMHACPFTDTKLQSCDNSTVQFMTHTPSRDDECSIQPTQPRWHHLNHHKHTKLHLQRLLLCAATTQPVVCASFFLTCSHHVYIYDVSSVKLAHFTLPHNNTCYAAPQALVRGTACCMSYLS